MSFYSTELQFFPSWLCSLVKILQYLNSLYNHNAANVMTPKLYFVTFWNFKLKRFKNEDIVLKETNLNSYDVLLLPNQNKEE